MIVQAIKQMKMMPMSIMRIIVVLAMAALFQPSMVLSGDAGIIYGRNGENLPSARQVVDFLTTNPRYKISLLRVLDADTDILEALDGKNLVVTIGVPNEAIALIAASQDAAEKWAQDHIISYARRGVRIRYVCVGNEAIPGVAASLVQQAIGNIYYSIRKQAGLDYIFVTTAVGPNVLGNSYPPSITEFAPNVADIMRSLTYYLYSIGSPLIINVYPYYALVSEPDRISLDYALFESNSYVFIDNGLEYYNLFDAMVDAFVAAMVRVVQKEDVKIVIGQTGWPTAGRDPYANIQNAMTYNNNLRRHAIDKGRTPRKADINLEVYISSMFDEIYNRPGDSQHFGTFYPNFTEVYPLWH